MIQWYLARPCIISGQDARTTRNFGIFFKLEVSNNYDIILIIGIPKLKHLEARIKALTNHPNGHIKSGFDEDK
jgi:muconolactone delta-isomerase